MRFDSALFLGISFILLLTPSFFSFPVFPASANVDLFFPAELSQNFSHIILFSWDGVQYDHLMRLLNDGKMPVLQGITSQGVLVMRARIVHQARIGFSYLSTILAKRKGPKTFRATHALIIKSFVESIFDKGEPLITPEMGYEEVRVVEQITRQIDKAS